MEKVRYKVIEFVVVTTVVLRVETEMVLPSIKFPSDKGKAALAFSTTLRRLNYQLKRRSNNEKNCTNSSLIVPIFLFPSYLHTRAGKNTSQSKGNCTRNLRSSYESKTFAINLYGAG